LVGLVHDESLNQMRRKREGGGTKLTTKKTKAQGRTPASLRKTLPHKKNAKGRGMVTHGEAILVVRKGVQG